LPPRLDHIRTLIGDLARPFAIISTSLSASISGVVIAVKVHDSFSGASLFMAAVYAGVGALFGAKAWENAKSGQAQANIEIARVGAPQPPPG